MTRRLVIFALCAAIGPNAVWAGEAGLTPQGPSQLFASPCFFQVAGPTILPVAEWFLALITEENHAPVFIHQVPISQLT